MHKQTKSCDSAPDPFSLYKAKTFWLAQLNKSMNHEKQNLRIIIALSRRKHAFICRARLVFPSSESKLRCPPSQEALYDGTKVRDVLFHMLFHMLRDVLANMLAPAFSAREESKASTTRLADCVAKDACVWPWRRLYRWLPGTQQLDLMRPCEYHASTADTTFIQLLR